MCIMKTEIKFINDKVVKKILTSERKENREYLVRIISAVTGIDKKILRNNIKLVTSEVGSNNNIVDSTVDAIFSDNNEYVNIEINYRFGKTTLVKNNVYLYHMILRQIDSSKSYDKVVPAIQININGKDTFGEGKFIYKSQMMEVSSKVVRDELLTIYDINLDFIRNVDYNKIKKGNILSLEKILYIFICDNKRVLDDIYKGDVIMDKVRDNFDTYRNDVDDVLYYNPDELNRMLDEEELEEARKKAREEGLKQGREEGKEEGLKEGREEGTETANLSNLKNLMEALKISAESAIDLVKIPAEEREKYLAKL